MRSAELGEQLIAAGARTIVADLRHLKSTVVACAAGEPRRQLIR